MAGCGWGRTCDFRLMCFVALTGIGPNFLTAQACEEADDALELVEHPFFTFGDFEPGMGGAFQGFGEGGGRSGVGVQFELALDFAAQGAFLGGAELVEAGQKRGSEADEGLLPPGFGAVFGGESGEAGVEEVLEFGGDQVGAGVGSVAETATGGVAFALERDGAAGFGAIGAGCCDLFFGGHALLATR